MYEEKNKLRSLAVVCLEDELVDDVSLLQYNGVSEVCSSSVDDDDKEDNDEDEEEYDDDEEEYEDDDDEDNDEDDDLEDFDDDEEY